MGRQGTKTREDNAKALTAARWPRDAGRVAEPVSRRCSESQFTMFSDPEFFYDLLRSPSGANGLHQYCQLMLTSEYL
jgi:hypothetical protein